MEMTGCSDGASPDLRFDMEGLVAVAPSTEGYLVGSCRP